MNRYKYLVTYQCKDGTGNVYYKAPLKTKGQIEKCEDSISKREDRKCIVTNFIRIK